MIRWVTQLHLRAFANIYSYKNSVQSLSHVWCFVNPWATACLASLPNTNSQSLLKLISIESVMPSNHYILCCPLLLLPSIFPSIRVYFNESVLHIRWPKYGVSASASVLPMNIQDRFPLGWTSWSSCTARDSQESSPTPQFKGINSLVLSFLYRPNLTSIHDYWKNIALTRQIFAGKVMSLLDNMLSRLVITLLPKSKPLLISGCSHHLQWFWSPQKRKSVVISTVAPSICHEVMGPDAMILVFWMLSFKPTFSLSSFTFIKRFFSSSLSEWCHLHIWGYWYSSRNLDSGLCFLQPSVSHDVLCI